MTPSTLQQREQVLTVDVGRRAAPVSALRKEILAVGKHSFICTPWGRHSLRLASAS